jgi:hypothetical protein
VREDVHAVFERVANILLGVHVRVHSDPVFVRRLGDGLVVCRRQLVNWTCALITSTPALISSSVAAAASSGVLISFYMMFISGG